MKALDLIKIMDIYKISYPANPSIDQLIKVLDEFENSAHNAINMIQRQLGLIYPTHQLLMIIPNLSIYKPINTNPLEWQDLREQRASTIKTIAQSYRIPYNKKLNTINTINEYLHLATPEARHYLKSNIKLLCRYCSYIGYKPELIYQIKQSYHTHESINNRVNELQKRTEELEAQIRQIQDKIGQLVIMQPYQPTTSATVPKYLDDGFIYCIKNQNQCKIGKSSYKTYDQLVRKLIRRYGTPFGLSKLDHTNFKCKWFSDITEAEKKVHRKYDWCRESSIREVFNIDFNEVIL